jgi:hypothetical protein
MEMLTSQRESNPDVNTFIPGDGTDVESPESPGRGDSTDTEPPRDRDVVPVPPGAQPAAPIEEPPESDRPPVGDVHDSPKKIAG